MNLTFSPEEQAFREEVRRFLADALPSDIRERVRLGRHLPADDHIRWQNILSDQGWLAANWPVEHGGQAGARCSDISSMKSAPPPTPLRWCPLASIWSRQ